ncbi:M20 family metallo-hydrolase [Natrarchaeobaculum sulfurireducens]|uniref:Acetylornithine deacetylase/Succinyl-diaminopimelate desuccinylase n=1 Tax=Natrarchaeobaculum sulfurireducens TaxID=2044521 RepID=A0A346PK95_9EURY|nr:M20 family metallo-hydrolase [Natrarchaeobaculum sulfurireducens]AXR79940.1 Acetylornithine deacetylase/Succinyl-diaminopimelate desuccinylase [Natrarchaeobaculum sulfurireducens]
MRVSEERLRSSIRRNAEYGQIVSDDGNGRTVLTGSEANRNARDELVSQLRSVGLEVSIDAVGNIVGRWYPPGCDPDTKPVASGSHLDSVPEGGIFDGPLGVYAALEAVRSLKEQGVELSRPIDVVCFTEEEGQRFSNGLLGSSVAAGMISVAEAHALEDESGTRFDDALEEIGYLGTGQVNAADWDSWLELHIEQGTTLQSKNAAAGIVTAITGITHCYLEIEGEADHAGSTPMSERTDAMTAASEIILELEDAANDIVSDESASAVATVGSVSATPNATNVIPGSVSLGVDIRDIEGASIATLVEALSRAARSVERERGVEVSIARPYDVPPAPMAERCKAALTAAGREVGLETIHMHSGAAHDTMQVASVTDAGLLFAPSRDGISHNPREWTDWSDCADATAILTAALATLAE